MLDQWQAYVGPAEFCPEGQYLAIHHHNSIGPIKGSTPDIIGGPMSAPQWLYVQCIYVSDEENYKSAFLLTFF